MKFIPLSSITVAANRQRREFDPAALQDLGESIARIGLLQAPVVREADGKVILVAGERRLRAITDLHELGTMFCYNGHPVPDGMVPCATLGELSPLEAWEAELEENIRRVDLTWQERAAATAALADLRSKQAEANDAPPPTAVDIARELRSAPADAPRETLGYEPQQVRDQLIVSKFLDDPEVAAASSLAEARKIIRKKEERKQNIELAATLGKTFSSQQHTLLQGDSLVWMRQASADSFEIILTDPPYGMGADKFGDSGAGTQAAAHFYDDSFESWLALMKVFAPESYRVAATDAHLYAFCDFDNFSMLKDMMREAGWNVFRTPLIWHNPDGFRAPWPDKGPQRKYELILFAVKGGKKVNALKGDVIEARKDSARGHPAQKPVALLTELLRRSAKPGDRVLDPFAGSGSTLEACHELKLTCTAIEQDPGAFGIAAKLLASLSAYDEGLF